MVVLNCLHPYFVSNGFGERVATPCGTCELCRARRTLDWSTRLEMENADSYSKFVTLTYNAKHSDQFDDLEKRDFQLFLKRLRKHCWKYHGVKLRYFLCGEYGDKFGRRHGHVILFSRDENFLDIDDMEIQKCWCKGNIDVGTVTPQSIRYVAGYCLKKATPKHLKVLVKDEDGTPVEHYRTPPFLLMSKGLGCRFMALHFKKLLFWKCLHMGERVLPLPKVFFKNFVKNTKYEAHWLVEQDLQFTIRRLKLLDEAKRLGMSFESYCSLLVQRKLEKRLKSLKKRAGIA